MAVISGTKIRAEAVVTKWLTRLWARHPGWMIRMPDQTDIDDLVNLIVEELKE